MKVRIINKQGQYWEFDSVAKAKPHIKKERLSDFTILKINGHSYRVYDDREFSTEEMARKIYGD